MKNDFHFPPILKFPNIPGALAGESLDEIMRLFNGLDWDDVTFVREASGLPVIVKGLFSPDDAKAAIRALAPLTTTYCGCAKNWKAIRRIPNTFIRSMALVTSSYGKFLYLFQSWIYEE